MSNATPPPLADVNHTDQPSQTATNLTDGTWFSEVNGQDGTAFSLQLSDGKLLHSEQSPYQTIEVYDTKTFGKLMVIDGCTMVSSRDNFIYHEMMAHPALFSHPAPKRVCIIGGGDCGTLQEVLKHDGVESVVQIDIDERVTCVSEQYFPELCANNNDPRVTLMFDDGIRWVNDAPDESLDVIIVDSTDPVGPGEALFTKAFYQSCWRALSQRGILVQQSESPLLHFERIIQPMQQRLHASAFSQSKTLVFPQVIYPSGWWSATMATKNGKLKFRRKRASKYLAFPTRYYNAKIHKASQALPQFMLDAS
ncbi:MAG TPA: polyamine aminopropyltransferase [Thiothrix sp.]|nr:polyamine aminopropyltransferase [Thiothrix sp.]